VDCGICVQVCPTGIDIRKGLQYECIGCAACVDGCDQVMDKMGYPRGLIRYSTENALKNHWTQSQLWRRVARPRTLIYSALLGTIVIAFFGTLAWRVPLKVDVIRDRGTLARLVDEGVVENVYTLRIMNTQEVPHRFQVKVSGIDTIAVASESIVELPGASTKSFPVRVQVQPGHGVPGSNHIMFEIKELNHEDIAVREKSAFMVPR
jgi:cytochrome c oxidase accessory protein FixG